MGAGYYLEHTLRRKSRRYAAYEVNCINVSSGRIWSKLALHVRGEVVYLPGLWRWQVTRFKKIIEHAIVIDIDAQLAPNIVLIEKAEQKIDSFLEQNKYLRQSQVTKIAQDLLEFLAGANQLIRAILDNPYSKKGEYGIRLGRHLDRITDFIDPGSNLIKIHNKHFVEQELIECDRFFDQIEKSPLTEEQRRSAIILEDRNLLIAAAGSGKSSTLVGKVGYVIKKGYFAPADILTLAFNRKAANELTHRLSDRVTPLINGDRVKGHTFHALGRWLVIKVARKEKRNVKLSQKFEYKPRLANVLQECMRGDDFRNDWVMFSTLYREPIPADDAFKTEEDYRLYVDFQRKKRAGGEAARYQALNGGVPVRSAEELSIANWLYAQGVPFLYEKSFTPVPEGWPKYEPDFYFPEIDTWYEHFALNSEGKAPSWFGDYAKQAEEKRDWLTDHVKPGHWFETRSADYRSGKLHDNLAKELKARGQKFRPRTPEQVLARIKELRQVDVLDFILEIIDLVKGNMFDQATFEQKLIKMGDPFRAQKFIKIFWPLYEAYNARLSAEGKIDFNDMISQAVRGLEAGKVKSPYKLILVDEFQDLSIGRARLIKALLAQHKNSVLFGVGDDWQAINGFAGSDLSLFLGFGDEFGPTETTRLTMTFRCAQGISDVGAFFIQENKKGQSAKEVISVLDKTISGVVDLRGVTEDTTLKKIEIQLQELSNLIVPKRGKQNKISVFLLSRYSEEKTYELIKTPNWLESILKRFSHTLDIKFMNMHGSKGLEADYVFLIGMKQGPGLAFPCKITSDPLKIALLSNKDEYPFAEERRLFYVALTRARKKAYVYFDEQKPSEFVVELMQEKYQARVTYNGGELPKRCSKCKKGFIVLRPGVKGKYRSFWGCTTFPKCRNTKNIYKRLARRAYS